MSPNTPQAAGLRAVRTVLAAVKGQASVWRSRCSQQGAWAVPVRQAVRQALPFPTVYILTGVGRRTTTTPSSIRWENPRDGTSRNGIESPLGDAQGGHKGK